MLKVYFDSFKAIGPNAYGRTFGSVTVEFGGKTIEAKAVKTNSDAIYVGGFVGRYRTSNNAWNVEVFCNDENRVSVYFGRDDRSGRFDKRNAISYEPETFATVSCKEYWSAV